MSDNDLGDFEDSGDESADPTEQENQGDNYVEDEEDETELLTLTEEEIGGDNVEILTEEMNELERRVVNMEGEVERIRPLDEENPLGLDPRVGEKDVAFDRAKPGAKVYVLAELAETVMDYEERFPESPPLDEYAGNVVTRFARGDAVFACVYIKDSLTSVDTTLTAYPMPSSRLTRYPAEAASMVGGTSVEFDRTPVPGEGERDGGGDSRTTIGCGCGDYSVEVPTGEVPAIDVICPECGNHFGQGEANVGTVDAEGS